MSHLRLLIALFFICQHLTIYAAEIKGKIVLSEDWAPVIYVSAINSFDQLYTSSFDLLRYKIDVDSSGYFEATNLDLPDLDLLYRLHVCKKGDPESTIIIGGRDENFVHFIMNNDSEIVLECDSFKPGLSSCTINGHRANKSLTQLFDLNRSLEIPPEIPSENNRLYVKKRVHAGLHALIDTSSNEVIRLLSIHVLNDRFKNENNLNAMKRLESYLKSSNYDGIYYDDFVNRLEYLKFQQNEKTKNSIARATWLILPLLLILLLWNYRRRIFRHTDKLTSLSLQEKKVFDLLKKGKSNKEISSELHIEVSTVKSHLHRIYTRLGVKSRKEIIDGKW